MAVQSIAAFPQAAVIIEAELPDFVAVEAAGEDEARQVGESPGYWIVKIYMYNQDLFNTKIFRDTDLI